MERVYKMKQICLLIILIMFLGGCMATEKNKEQGQSYQGTWKDRRDERERLRVEKIRSHNWGTRIESDLINRYIRIGMTKQQVRASMGSPNGGINYTTSAWGQDEQWVYRPDPMLDRYGTKYYYFKNGVLTSYQD